MKDCPNCGKDVSVLVANGETVCPSCAASLKPGDNRSNRAGLRLAFWATFLLTPVVGVLLIPTGLSLFIVPGGTILAGNLLAQLYVKKDGRRTAMTCVFALMLLIVYAGIGFVGCLVVLSQLKI